MMTDKQTDEKEKRRNEKRKKIQAKKRKVHMMIPKVRRRHTECFLMKPRKNRLKWNEAQRDNSESTMAGRTHTRKHNFKSLIDT